MKILARLAIAALLLASGLSIAGEDGTERAVRAATAEWIETFNSRDGAKIAALYAPEAVFLGTISPTIRTTPEQVLEYFVASATRRPTLRMTLGEQHVRVYGDVAFNSGFYTSRFVQDGQEIVNPMRFSFAYRRDGERWLIVNHHSSRIPTP